MSDWRKKFMEYFSCRLGLLGPIWSCLPKVNAYGGRFLILPHLYDVMRYTTMMSQWQIPTKFSQMALLYSVML